MSARRLLELLIRPKRACDLKTIDSHLNLFLVLTCIGACLAWEEGNLSERISHNLKVSLLRYPKHMMPVRSVAVESKHEPKEGIEKMSEIIYSE